MEIPECILDLTYENQKHRFKYPQEVPHIMPLEDPFNRENNKMLLTILLRTGKKYRKIAKGEINFYKKYFMTETLSVQKWVYLNLYETQLEQMGHSTNILKAVTNTGRIYIKAQLLDPLLEGGEGLPKPKSVFDSISVYSATTHASAMTKILKNNLKNLPNLKDKAMANKTEKYRSVTEHSNEFLRSLKNRKNLTPENIFEDIEEENPEQPKKEEFYDGLSDVSISFIDNQEEGKEVEIEKMNYEIDELVSKIKVIFDNKIDEVLPQDPNELKNFVKNFTSQIGNISENYSQNLLTLADINKRIKFQAKDFYERYKDAKKTFKRERRELKYKNKQLENEVNINNDERVKLQNQLDDVKNELNFFRHKLGIKDNTASSDEDFVLLLEILNSLDVSSNQTEILEGLDDGEKEVLNSIIQRYSLGKVNQTNLNNQEVNQQDEEQNYNDEDIIVSKIEHIVNENFKNKKIHNITIEQLDDDNFKFSDKTVALYLDGEILKVKEKGFDTFQDWLVAHFGIGVEKPSPVKKSNVTTNNKSPIQAMIDKKLAEKKVQLAKASASSTSNTARNKTPVSKKD